MRWIRRILIGLMVLVLGLGVFLVFLVRSSFPKVDGEVVLEGPDSRIEVIRDDWGVPHIYATTAHDLFFAQGYTHAQERFWQMDFWRHIGSGRMAEMFGEDIIDTDIFLRSLDLQGLARQELESMSPEARLFFEAYAAGVNAYLDGKSNRQVSLEYAILGLQNSGYVIEPWDPIHTLTWAKLMSWDLSGNLRDEIDRTVLATSLPLDRVEQLYPPFPDGHPYIVEGWSSPSIRAGSPVPEEALTPLLRVAESAARVFALTGGGFEGIGSNNWVVGGSKTASGMPLLANDTHLAIQMPAIWFANGLHCHPVGPACPYEAVGFSFAGAPGVVIGHSGDIAWGVTTQSVDTQDLFIERLNPANPDQYELDGEWVDFEVRVETFKVAGEEDVTHRMLVSRHGPVVSGTLVDTEDFSSTAAFEGPDSYVVSLAWETLKPSTLAEAFTILNRARNYDDFLAAAAMWDIAAQNLVYADNEGNIAYQSTGRVPIRASGDGRYPVPGWTRDNDWVGTVPFEDMPRMLNPPEGFIATANQYVIPSSSDPFLTGDGGYGYRADRIVEILSSSSGHTVESMQRLQMDNFDGGAVNVVPHLLRVDSAGDAGVTAIKNALREWTSSSTPFQMDADSPAAAAYQATWRHLLANTFHDDLPPDYWPDGGGRWFAVVADLLESPEDPFWDDSSTAPVERRDDILLKSMRDAHAELRALFGRPDRWDWGRMHRANFENVTLGRSGIAPIEWLFNRAAPPRVAGSDEIVNSVGWDATVGYAVDWIPAQRTVVDFSDVDRSTFVHSTGQSGHAFHRHYADMIGPWTDGFHVPMHWSRDAVVANARTTLILTPAN